MGVLGQIHPLIAENYSHRRGCVAELAALEGALEQERVPQPAEVPHRHARPQVITVGALEDCIAEAGGKLLRKIDLFDIYRGPRSHRAKTCSSRCAHPTTPDANDEDSVNTVNRGALRHERTSCCAEYRGLQHHILWCNFERKMKCCPYLQCSASIV